MIVAISEVRKIVMNGDIFSALQIHKAVILPFLVTRTYKYQDGLFSGYMFFTQFHENRTSAVYNDDIQLWNRGRTYRHKQLANRSPKKKPIGSGALPMRTWYRAG
jgi:hypothetical protein